MTERVTPEGAAPEPVNPARAETELPGVTAEPASPAPLPTLPELLAEQTRIQRQIMEVTGRASKKGPISVNITPQNLRWD